MLKELVKRSRRQRNVHERDVSFEVVYDLQDVTSGSSRSAGSYGLTV